MSLRAALMAVGLLGLGWVLFVSFVAMGPLGWLAFGTIFAVGTAQVVRKLLRRSRSTQGVTTVRNCPACGAPNDPDRTACRHCEAEL
ncbi:zinc ribbon domain-containing protein [Natrononativus amylolyticus]|uniref:zinc ribbon domain-containing protein n=1 Tax=Natrononativus amylolyticus TaxID=2963434 RepID=UPI0020CEA11C|nr:zinc ribbon domain-containing protein [Natrononativus amylolyticus]